MTLIIKDPQIAALAEELRVFTKAESVEEVVREALKMQIEAVRWREEMGEGVSKAGAMANVTGQPTRTLP